MRKQLPGASAALAAVESEVFGAGRASRLQDTASDYLHTLWTPASNLEAISSVFALVYKFRRSADTQTNGFERKLLLCTVMSSRI